MNINIVIIIFQYNDMSDGAANYGTPLDFIAFLDIFIHYRDKSLMYEVLYLHQNFTNCVSSQYTYFDMLSCQISLQIIKGSLV